MADLNPVLRNSQIQWLGCPRFQLHHQPMPCAGLQRPPVGESMGKKYTPEAIVPDSGPDWHQWRRCRRWIIKLPAIFAPTPSGRHRATGNRQYDNKHTSRQDPESHRGRGDITTPIEYWEFGYRSKGRICRSVRFLIGRGGVWVLAEGEKELEGFEPKEEKGCWPDDGYVLIMCKWAYLGGYTTCITFQHYHSKRNHLYIFNLFLLSSLYLRYRQIFRKSGNHSLRRIFCSERRDPIGKYVHTYKYRWVMLGNHQRLHT